ncbi:ThuA domain-containing protein [Microbacterium sp. SA39]|uniref:ThuA domain-containing protein n=1 Tax=Microbacterium sp. SA39 TaxID=1263625 RepID=UPI0005FA6D52|nr:ThuA domain-containing protein [Microbacterium sp. SA39]KJQ54243.1 Trehalose utilization [Microbacterium sp. SA39]
MNSRRALIVRGGWPGHQPVETTDLFRPFLGDNGFDIRIEESSEIYADAHVMARTDLIVQAVSMSEISSAAIKGLREAVIAGTGFAGWHGGIVDSYRINSDYLQLVGGQFVKHPSKAPEEIRGDGADSFLPHTIDITELGRDHEITRGIANFALTTEQYWVLHDDLNDVLATTTHPARPDQPWHRPITSPAVWTRSWGAGRVFVATPGHDTEVLRDANVRTIVERGLLWASRRGSA